MKDEIQKLSAMDRQVGGDHYTKMKIQPTEFCMANDLDHCQSNVIKYVCRHGSKAGINGADDLRKAIHYIEMLIEFKYPEPDASIHATDPDPYVHVSSYPIIASNTTREQVTMGFPSITAKGMTGGVNAYEKTIDEGV